ncbi:hypothetical protein EON80_11920 [bacterium]|nr:MAG: hypothetical protein EON80_11920 [bacterium]
MTELGHVLDPDERLLARLLWNAVKHAEVGHDIKAAREAFKGSSSRVRGALLRAEFTRARQQCPGTSMRNPFEIVSST